MAEKPESKPVAPKKPEGEKKAPIPNGVEKKEVQDRRKALEDKTLKLKASRARSDHKKDEGEAQKLLKSFDLGLEKKENKDAEEKDENFVETQETKDTKEKEKAETEYREELKKSFDADKKDTPQEPEKLKKLEAKYMGQYIDIMRGDEPKKFGEKDVEFLTQNFPDAYREALLEKTVDPDSSLGKVKKVILERVADGAASIDRSDFKSDKEYQDALLKNFENITGIKIDEKSAEGLIGEFINDPKDKQSQEIIQALAPIVAEGSSEDSRGWSNHMESGAFQDSNPNLTQNTGESFSDSPEFNRIKSLYNGISEANNPSQIQEFHKAAGLNAGPKTPWCMSFVQYVLRKHYGYQGPQTAAARDGLRIGTETKNPGPGDLVLMPRNGGSGYHIAFVERVDGNTLTYWGGNQSNMVCSKKTSINSPGLQFRDITNSGKTNTGGH